jgi:hypothetical protein
MHPKIKTETLCSCCKRPLYPTQEDWDECWECRGRPSGASSGARRALPGLRDPACPHAIPGGAT